ncbi:MAG TPA: amidohydrolase family protein [Amnibacterium sp.]|uniref:amidohydrolase family protein n=1 Tax=Amnibacterium sp. TaxID=1872496 RepID=UPI002F94C3CF
MIPALPLRIDALRGARLADGTPVDVRLDGPVVAAIEPAGALDGEPGEALDLDGFVLLTAGAEPHAHLDKALTFDVIAPPLGDLPSAIAAFHTYAITSDEHDIADRARRTLGRMLANGITAVRSHVNFSPGPDPLAGFRALQRVRAEFAGLLDLQLVTLPADDTVDEVHEEAFALGADLVGGAPHLWPDPIAATDRLLDLAERVGVGADLHADESLDGPITLGRFAERARSWSLPRSAGHCVRLGMLREDELAVLVEAIRDADIGIIGLPITNLYLQGWDSPVATPRGITALRALIDAGVRVAAGADNVRDPFNPLGRCDPLETAMLLVTAAHLTPAEALHLVGDGARDVLGLPPAGPRVGAVADLLAVRADSATEAIAFASADRYVLHAGRLVAASVLEQRVAVPAREAVLTATETGAA